MPPFPSIDAVSCCFQLASWESHDHLVYRLADLPQPEEEYACGVGHPATTQKTGSSSAAHPFASIVQALQEKRTRTAQATSVTRKPPVTKMQRSRFPFANPAPSADFESQSALNTVEAFAVNDYERWSHWQGYTGIAHVPDSLCVLTCQCFRASRRFTVQHRGWILWAEQLLVW